MSHPASKFDDQSGSVRPLNKTTPFVIICIGAAGVFLLWLLGHKHDMAGTQFDLPSRAEVQSARQ